VGCEGDADSSKEGFVSEETPKTSALLGKILEETGVLNQINAPEAWVTLCRNLEHRLKRSEDARKSLSAGIDHLQKIETDLRAQVDDRDLEIAELERENARLRELVNRACKIIDVPEDAPITAWASDEEINDLLKDCGDILSNVSDHRHQPGASVETKSNL
jgi:DNA repair exonuclease SbcCD ATPase subunit